VFTLDVWGAVSLPRRYQSRAHLRVLLVRDCYDSCKGVVNTPARSMARDPATGILSSEVRFEEAQTQHIVEEYDRFADDEFATASSVNSSISTALCMGAATSSSVFYCAICLRTVTGVQTLSLQLQCGHTFCATCVCRWKVVGTSATCPTCRQPDEAVFGLRVPSHMYAMSDDTRDSSSGSIASVRIQQAIGIMCLINLLFVLACLSLSLQTAAESR